MQEIHFCSPLGSCFYGFDPVTLVATVTTTFIQRGASAHEIIDVEYEDCTPSCGTPTDLKILPPAEQLS